MSGTGPEHSEPLEAHGVDGEGDSRRVFFTGELSVGRKHVIQGDAEGANGDAEGAKSHVAGAGPSPDVA